jgi:lipopolysaccharide transport system permease protein
LPILLVLVYSYGKVPTWNWLVAMPLLIAVQFVVCYGLGLMVSMVNAFFRDMEHIINVLLSLLFWMTPILYPLEAVPEKYRVYLSLNPATYLIQSWRDIFFSNRINWDYIFISMLTATVVLLAGSLVFKRLDRRLDEVL